MSKLTCVSGLNKNQEFPLHDGTTVLGRSRAVNFIVLDSECSRQHCEIFRDGKFHAVEDLHSKNGTYVNGERIVGRHVLQIGDRISVGATTMVLCDDNATCRDFNVGGVSVVAGVQVEEFSNLVARKPLPVRPPPRHDTITARLCRFWWHRPRKHAA
jgi:pSer/pThr/pTyr-binding forkhead associated (FHA) protein